MRNKVFKSNRVVYGLLLVGLLLLDLQLELLDFLNSLISIKQRLFNLALFTTKNVSMSSLKFRKLIIDLL